MAFGLTQWLMSFAIFLIVLTIITWSAVHLGRKDQNSTDIIMQRFLDVDNSFEWENKSLYPAIVHTSTALFANDQGSEIPDSAKFYEIFRTFNSTEDSAVNYSTYNYDTVTTTSAPFVVGNDSTRAWNDDITITLYNTSDKTFVLDNRRNVSGKVTILPNHISQTARSASTHNAKLLDVDKLWKDLSQSAGTELSEFLRDAENGTSDAFAAFSFTRALFDAKQLNTTERAKTIRVI